MPPSRGLNRQAAQLLAQAVEWRLLGLLFEYPSGRWRSQIEALLCDVRKEELRRLALRALETASEGAYMTLFGPAGSVPVREAACRSGTQPGYLMAELSAYYEAFGYRPACGEADDHFAVELDFLSYLKVKQAYALASGQAEHAGVTAEAAASFCRDHIAFMAGLVAGAFPQGSPEYLVRAAGTIVQKARMHGIAGYPSKSPPPR